MLCATLQGLYPQSVAFRVYCDPPGGRVGSGGGTLVALMALLREEAPEVAAASDADTLSRGVAAFFSSRRVLLLHAGGESRRLPCYVPEGKLFAPLALPSASAFTPVVLDVLLSLYFRYPWSEGELILASGDVIVDFDTATLPTGFARGDLCGFGKPTSLQQGCRHGVFVFGEADGADGAGGPTRPVTGFLQKAPPETLRLQALLPAGAGGLAEACAVDTGIFSMSPGFVAALLGWAAAPMAAPMTLKKGGEGGEGGEGTQGGVLLLNCGALAIDGMGESPNLARRVARREWPGSTGGTGSAMACIELGEGCSLRLSDGFHLCVGLACVADLSDEATAAGGYSLDLLAWPLPEGLCLDGRALSSAHGGDDERVLLVYSSTDSFKRAASLSSLLFCAQPMEAWLLQRGLSASDLWSEAELQAEQQGQGIELWVAKLFCVLPPSPAAAELVAGYYAPPQPGWAEHFRRAARLSLGEVNARTSPQGRDATRQQLRRKAGAS